MRLRLFRRRPVEEPVAVIASYPFSRRTAHMLLMPDGRVRWSCDCDAALRSTRRNLPPWCKHIEKASAKRSVGRLFGETTVRRTPKH